jgi:hypothetical protein
MDHTTTAQTEDPALATGEPTAEMTIQPVMTTVDAGAAVVVPEVSDQTLTPPALPPIPGFNLDGVSRNQGYAIRTMLVFADCAVQPSTEAVFHVLGRNFDTVGALVWWLHRIGKSGLSPRTKNKDLIDALRVVAHGLHRQLKTEIGLPIPRW